MRVKLCFMMLIVMATVSLGFTFDISAYDYEPPLQKAYMEEESMIVGGAATVFEVTPIVSSKHIDEAAEELNEIEEEIAAQEQSSGSYGMSERELFAHLVMAEAGGEDLQGQIMVANVVLNRVACSYGGYSTITDVIHHPNQFEPVSTGRIWYVSPTSSVYEAVDRALAGEDYSNDSNLNLYAVGTRLMYFYSGTGPTLINSYPHNLHILTSSCKKAL